MSKEKSRTITPYDDLLWPKFLLLWRDFETWWDAQLYHVTDQNGNVHPLKPCFDDFINWLKKEYHYDK